MYAVNQNRHYKRPNQTMDQSDIERHDRAKRIKLAKVIDVCIQCPKCESLLSVGIPEGGGRQCTCVTCDQRLFVHKYVDSTTVDEPNVEQDVGLSTSTEPNSFLTPMTTKDRIHKSHEAGGGVSVEPAILTNRSCSKRGRDEPLPVQTKRGKLCFEEIQPELKMLSMPPDVLSDCVLNKVDMCTLSRLDCTCHEMRAHVQKLTMAHARPLNLNLRKQEKWSDLRLTIHCMWTQYGMGTGMTNSSSSLSPVFPSSSSSSPSLLTSEFAPLDPGTSAPSKLYTCGSGIFGQVGHQYKVDYVLPCEVDAFRGINLIDVSGGGRHSCVLSRGGFVYTCGKGHHGQLGVNILDDKVHDMTMTINDKYADNDDAYGPFMVLDTDIADNTDTHGNTIKCVSAGFDHTMVVYQNGTAKCFGRGASGRLGINSKDDEHKPKSISNLMNTSSKRVSSAAGTRFIYVGSGLVHSALISDTGEVYTAGHRRNGRLGHGRAGGMQTRSGAASIRDGQPQLIPRKIASLQKVRIVQASLGSYHTAMLSSEGEVYTFGHGTSGQLGLGNGDDVHTPTKVKNLVFNGNPVIQLAAGYEHTAALTLSGSVYTFGLGERGQLGHGSQYNEFYPRIVKDLHRLYGCAVQISAGGYHTVARLEDGRVVTFGNNESGQLGHGDKEHAYVPRVVDDIADRCVRNVSAGGTHTLFLLDASQNQ